MEQSFQHRCYLHNLSSAESTEPISSPERPTSTPAALQQTLHLVHLPRPRNGYIPIGNGLPHI